jgi:predicted nuclease of predicted toxin-antitoxin system
VIQFLVDECLSPGLVRVANAYGYVAFHVTHRGWPARPDAFLLRQILAEDLTIVTSNWQDFRPMLRRAELHAGAVVLPSVPLTEQLELFDLALETISGNDPPLDMVNTVVAVNVSGLVTVYGFP